MGYPEKLQKFCALRGIDQSSLAERVGVSKSSMSRILSGLQEPKLQLAYLIARALDVPLDYLVDDDQQEVPRSRWAALSEDESAILRFVRRLGSEVAMDRLLAVPTPSKSNGRDDAVERSYDTPSGNH